MSDMDKKPQVAVIMGSQSDWDIMKNSVETLEKMGMKAEVRVISAHRAPECLFDYVSQLEERGFEAVIAGAGMAAHLPGVTAAKTLLPVFGVPLMGNAFTGLDALLSMVQMPAGIPVGTLAVGKAGAVNAALLVTAQVARKYPEVRELWAAFRNEQTKAIEAIGDPRI